MDYFKLLAGSCIGIVMGWFSEYLTRLMVKTSTYLNNRAYCMAILLVKLLLYFFILVAASFIGAGLMLYVAVSMVITIITTGVWRFLHG